LFLCFFLNPSFTHLVQHIFSDLWFLLTIITSIVNNFLCCGFHCTFENTPFSIDTLLGSILHAIYDLVHKANQPKTPWKSLPDNLHNLAGVADEHGRSLHLNKVTMHNFYRKSGTGHISKYDFEHFPLMLNILFGPLLLLVLLLPIYVFFLMLPCA